MSYTGKRQISSEEQARSLERWSLSQFGGLTIIDWAHFEIYFTLKNITLSFIWLQHDFEFSFNKFNLIFSQIKILNIGLQWLPDSVVHKEVTTTKTLMRVMIYKSSTSLSEVSKPTLHWLSDRIVDHCSCNTKHAFTADTKTSDQIHCLISYVCYAISHRHVLYYIWPLGSDMPCKFVYFKTLGQSPYKSLTRLIVRFALLDLFPVSDYPFGILKLFLKTVIY